MSDIIKEEIETTTEDIDYKTLFDDLQKKYSDLEAEKKSFENENAEIKKNYESLLSENQKTKELNFTLSRQLNTGVDKIPQPEEILNNMFLGGN